MRCQIISSPLQGANLSPLICKTTVLTQRVDTWSKSIIKTLQRFWKKLLYCLYSQPVFIYSKSTIEHQNNVWILFKVTIHTPERCQWLRSSVFIINFEYHTLFFYFHCWLLASTYWLGCWLWQVTFLTRWQSLTCRLLALGWCRCFTRFLFS